MARTNDLVTYDAGCGMCSRARDLGRRLLGRRVRWLPLQHPAATRMLRRPAVELQDRMHLRRPDGRILVGAAAIAHLLRRRPETWLLGGLLDLPGLRHLAARAYAALAARRAPCALPLRSQP